MSQAMRKLTSVISKSRTAVIFINQVRMKIGVVYGNPEVTTGGNALKFYTSLRIEIRGGNKIKVGDEEIGRRTKVKVVKNKVAPPFRQAEFDITFGQGINQIGEIVDLGVDGGFINKSGAWYSLGEERMGQGRENACLYLKERPEAASALTARIKESFGLNPDLFRKDSPGNGDEDF
jgi:recombination protein RecA